MACRLVHFVALLFSPDTWDKVVIKARVNTTENTSDA